MVKQLPSVPAIVVIDDDDVEPLTSPGKKQDMVQQDTDRTEALLKQLLSDIEQIGLSYSTACAKRAELHRRLRSYNAALNFVSVARYHNRDHKKKSPVTGKFDVHLTPKRADTHVEYEHELKVPPHGRAVFLTVALTNHTDVALADGWGLHVRVATTSTFNNYQSTLCEMRAQLLHSIEPRGGITEMSFPLILQSHTPLLISAYLRFRQMGNSCVQNKTKYPETVDVKLPLCQNERVDILNMSSRTDPSAIKQKDLSQKWISSLARSSPGLSPHDDAEGTSRSHAIVHRFQVPIDRRNLSQELGIAQPPSSSESGMQMYTYKTILDGRFSLRVDEPPLSTAQGRTPCSVTVHGLGHIVPFVRAAILDRVIEHLSAAQSPVDIQVHGAVHINAWHKRLLDMTDEYTKDVREAQASLVALIRVLRTLTEGNMESNDSSSGVKIIDDANDERSFMTKALVTMCGSWERWRHALEELWSPKGMKYVERAAPNSTR